MWGLDRVGLKLFFIFFCSFSYWRTHKDFSRTRAQARLPPYPPFCSSSWCRALSKGQSEGRIRTQGILTAVSNHHSQFVDDIILSVEISIKEERYFKKKLKDFEDASGQLISLEKSRVFFLKQESSRNLRISDILAFQKAHLPTQYLGFPLVNGRHKVET